ncbi:hypothetical protein [Jannaschia donghaensis]|uniref:Uncharacterized protein n=1 Tax=Jannaschia donghaensis TaxID=420998 RepID=A0A0M6YKF3_9RHOB|nr:hypothetical protein [Jannaschia donghaensis]CTQ50420.1 hypothetical protein JDO7802_02444 [Jannaschia donghaensis]
MTALDGLDRLEAPGLWRASREEQRRAVYITVGDAELVIEDRSGIALSHWSLPALVRLNPGEMPARYAPDTDSDEQLEVEEPEMITALDRVMTAVEKGRSRPGALRRVTFGLVMGFLLGLGLLWLPGALRKQAAILIPTAQRAEIGTAMLGELTGLTGAPCANPTGVEGLGQFRDRLFPTRPVQLVVLRDLPQPTIALPGDLIVLSDRILVGQDDPDVAAGHVLSTQAAAQMQAPLEGFLDQMGFVNLTRMLITGEVPAAAIADHVERLILDDPARLSAEALRPAFATARLNWEPFARATNRQIGEAPPSQMPPAMEDTPWQALREICAP